ncbi:NAD(P)-binding protein [Massarina eburnea CBS 473.64]|uniref:NAD(P)-binding protein n=1 Tax=Massarina eburnea CBS 473.64 TaxID=1395130 RepID=A0A6A6SE51_9PLEO|nr:NAD(P)-binding protein [Massarina eburnea CBS 473.64]
MAAKTALSDNWNISAFVTDPSTDRAQALKKYSDKVTLYKGTLADSTSLEAALKGVDALFLNQYPSFTDDSETRQARNILQLAKAAGVKHVVHSTQLGLADPDFLNDKRWKTIIAPAVMGKYEVEKLVRASGIPWTILRPGWFMSNVTSPTVNHYLPGTADGQIVTSFKPDGILAAVDTDDIGAFAAAAFNDPEKFVGWHVPVASECLTTAELIDQISRVTGRSYNVHYRTAEETAALSHDPFTLGQSLTHGLEKLANMDEIKSYGVQLTSFHEYLLKNKDKLA